jgi:hypothetical protein
MAHRLVLFLPIYADLATLCNTYRIDPHLGRVLIMLVAPYIDGVVDFDVPSEYEALLKFQCDLHPDSIFLGCFSSNWARIQHSYLKLNHYPRKQGQAHSGIKAIIAYLLGFVHSVWLVQNTALHGDDSTTKLLSYKHTQLLVEIQELYDQVDNMLAADRSLFTETYEYWLDKPTTLLQTFLQRMRTMVKVSVAQAADMGANFRPIDSYFLPLIPPELLDVILGLPPIPPEPN